MPLYDAFIARLACWNCSATAVTELQTGALKAPSLRELKVGDRAELPEPEALGSYEADIVFKRPDAPGFCNFMIGWTCGSCKLVNWTIVRILDHVVVAIEPLRVNDINLDRIHVLSWDSAVDEFLFLNRGMNCTLKSGFEIDCACDKACGQVVPYFSVEDVHFEGGGEPAPGQELARQFGPQVVFGEIRDKMAEAVERRCFGRYDIETLRRELTNADREYRANPRQYPRRLKVYGRLPDG
ncbi:MAG: hypothetical protein KGR26_07105 [Cyanobacteria bacterium REEB65]|nr:hypothetical protein [Cyanobacteria bacterium REEB65]